MNQLIIGAFILNDQVALKEISMVIAHTVRNELEGFHVEHIPDKHMPRLNRSIREGIYNALFALANYDFDEFSQKYINYTFKAKPDYWEEPELLPDFRKSLAKLSSKVLFDSAFLTEQYTLGNIYRLANTGHIRIKGSYEFKEVDYEDGKKHLNKLKAELHKENYKFDHIIDGYVKRIRIPIL